MNITFIPNNIINEGFGDKSSSFNHCDKVIGPDGTIYDTKQIIALVNNACEELSNMTGGLINEYLVALPIVYTFQVPTMATDSRFIYMNPGFVLELVNMCGETTMGIAFVILHEVYHNLYLHKAREAANPVKFSDHRKANAAQDYEINWVIEHSFPDQRGAGEYDPDDPDDSPYEADGFTKKQLLSGVTNMCHGLIDDKFGGKPWEEIYDLISDPPKEQDDENNSKVIPLSPDYKNGYRDGWETAIRELRAKGLVESVKINDELLYEVVKLFESSNSSDYDTGYNAGYDAAMKAILAVMNPQPGGEGPFSPSDSDKPMPEKIDGLTPMKPINPPAQSRGSSSNSNKNPNIPIVMPNSQGEQNSNSKNSQEDTQDSQGKDQNVQPGQTSGEDTNQDVANQNGGNTQIPNNNSGDNKSNRVNKSGSSPISIAPTTPADQTGQNDGTASQEQLDDMRRKGESTIKVGITDGSYTGKMSAAANNKHVISTEEGDAIREKAGVKEINNEKSVGKVKNPFTSSNLSNIATGIKNLSKIGNQGGRGIGAVQAILDKIESVLTPKINWKEEMCKRFDACAMKLADAGWNKKQLSYDVYSRFDDYEGDAIENIILMIDTSGSIFTKNYLMQVIREFNELAKEVNPQNVDIVLFCDGIYYHHEFDTSTSIPDLTPEFNSNARLGGTTYSDCFAYIDEYYTKKGRDFACCVIFTDGDVTTASLPPKSKLYWDPGSRLDDDSKLLWFILLDEENKVELPYGGIIQMSHKDFERTLPISESMQSINKLNIPRRTIMNNKINEAFKKISSQKADLEKDRLSTDPNSSIKPDVASNAKRRMKELKERHSNILAYAAEDKEKIKEDIIQWLRANTNLRVRNSNEKYNDILDIKDDLLINLNPYNVKNLTLKGEVLENIPNYILFGDIPGNLEIGFNRKLEHFPAAFAYATVGGDFICTDMPNLKSLDEGPSVIKGNYILMRCNKLETLDGTPISHNNFRGYFLSDSTKFTDDDFYDTVDNGGIMKNDVSNAKESLMSVRTKVNRLVESRIALGKYYNSLNEAFSSNILSRLASIPDNKDALDKMKNIRVFWSKIPDDIITPVYNSVTKVIQARRVVNKDTSMFGLTICCDKDDHIHVIGTGNNTGEWKGNTWKYISDDVVPTINDRLTLVRAANSQTLEEYAVKRSQEVLTQLGINWEKGDIQKLSPVRSLDDLKFPHLYLVPEMCAHSYVIKGADDHKSAASKDPEFARNFSYKSQVARRDELSRNRLDKIAGSYFTGDLANGPAAKKYLKYLIDNNIIAEVNNAYYTNHGVRTALEKMQNSVKGIYDKITKELDELKDSHIISGRAYALIYARLMRSTYYAFNNYVNTEKDNVSSLEGTAKNYHDAVFGKSEFTDSEDVRNLNRKPFGKAQQIKNIERKSYRNGENWYSLYMTTLKTFAQILSKLAEAKRGNPDVLEEYADLIEIKFKDGKMYGDDFMLTFPR